MSQQQPPQEFNISSFFPLYQHIRQQVVSIENSDLTVEETQTLLEQFRNLDKLGIELIYVLIRVHSLQTMSADQKDYFEIPYQGDKLETNTNGVFNVKFDLRKFPNPLKHIIFKFIQIHLQKIHEESALHSKKSF
jgi:hypothetical protein